MVESENVDVGQDAQGNGLGVPFHARIRAWPAALTQSARQEYQAFVDEVRGDAGRDRLCAFLQDANVEKLVGGVFQGSPFLRGLIVRDSERLERILGTAPDAHFDQLCARLDERIAETQTLDDAMRAVRQFKSEAALLIALADIADVWPVLRVTEAITATADRALAAGVRFLFREATAKGDWLPESADRPEDGSGYIVLGMGKQGAYELNYSSDIDLIVFYEKERARLREGLETQAFFVRLTRDLVRFMDERTADGYVFRTDLRLRPDAGATQIALSTEAALLYYESFGQNWERAALIKSRPVAGDIEAGENLLAELAPFIWRKSLDFASIADIHAMKRQIHAFRGLGGISVAGHNVKLGAGGIREIEFFAQTQQLIAGGRQRNLRVRRTLDALSTLVENGWIEDDVRADLEDAYLYLRRIEHRLQMVNDEQTHELPADAEALERFAAFAGYADTAALSADITGMLKRVQSHYGVLFEDSPELTAAGANLVFAGEDDDPGTVATLRSMGFTRPDHVLAAVRAWHHGRYAAVRSPRSRELLTEVQPSLIAALADTADPDGAFTSFDRFVAELPAGVQLFSLLKANPNLMRLVANIMGTAPRLARILSRRRRLLDAVIDPMTFSTVPADDELDALIAEELAEAQDVQAMLDRARVVGSEQAFLIGVRILSGTVNASQAGTLYARLADRLIEAMQTEVENEQVRAHGKIPGGAAAVVAMGKLGGREMTASSDIDLILVYDCDPSAQESDGARGLAPSQYYARLTQRLITALSAPTAEGTLYEVDMRLRPSGQMGPVATRLSSFIEYQEKEAWTWEHMALTRARVVTGPPHLRAAVEDAIRHTLVQPREQAKTAADLLDMRQRIEKEKGTTNIWDLKQVRGGLVDLEFIVQFLQITNAAAHPEILDQTTLGALQKLGAAGVLAAEDTERLIATGRLIHDLMQILRLCLDDPFNPETAPRGLKELLARAGDSPDFAALEVKLKSALSDVSGLFDKLIR